MDKEILNQYIDACELVKETEEDLKKLRKDTVRIQNNSVVGSNPEYPYQAMHFRVAGEAFTDYRHPELVEETEYLLIDRKAKAAKLALAVDRFINELPPNMARIVRLKYKMGLSWSNVSTKLGYNTKSGAKMAFERYMKSEKLDNNT